MQANVKIYIYFFIYLYITANMAYDAARHRGSEPVNGSRQAHSDRTTVVAGCRVTLGLAVFWQMVCICYWETQITITFTSIHTNIPATRKEYQYATSRKQMHLNFSMRERWKMIQHQKNEFAAWLHSGPAMNMRNICWKHFLHLPNSFHNLLVQYQLRSHKLTVQTTSSSCRQRSCWIQYNTTEMVPFGANASPPYRSSQSVQFISSVFYCQTPKRLACGK